MFTVLHPELAGAHAVVVNWRDLDHALAGGSERYAWEAALALRDQGARVEYLTARDTGQSRHDVRDGIDVRRGGGAFGFYAFAAWSLLRRRRTLDVVVDPECGIPTFSPLFVRRSTAVVLVVHHVHQRQFDTYFPRPVAALGKWLERVAMRRVYRDRPTVAVSRSTRDEMAEQLGWTGPVGILENGSASPVPDEDAFLDKDRHRLVVLGRLVPHKRVDLVLRAMAPLVWDRPDLHLDVIGRGPEQEALEALAADLGLTDHVRFHGFVSEETKHDLLRRAALHVCASDVEGWGQVVIDAAGHGIPTVARDVPGLRDSIRDGHTGWLVPDHPDLDVVGARLGDAVRTALDELEVPENLRLAHKASQAWAAGFSWPRMHRETAALVAGELRHRRPALRASRSPQSVPTSAPPAAAAAPSER